MITPSGVSTAGSHAARPYIQQVDCAVGAHIGPLGACIFGSDPPPQPTETVVEQPAPVVVQPDGPPSDCSTTTIKHTDSMGNSETKTKTNC